MNVRRSVDVGWLLAGVVALAPGSTCAGSAVAETVYDADEEAASGRGVHCTAVDGADELLEAGTVVLLGELHGTQQIPSAAGDLVCAALERGLDVTVALEIPQSENERIQAYLDGAGSSEDRQRLLDGEFWNRNDQDGRSSRAMFDLIERLRELRAKTQAVQVLLIDNELVPDRDVFMAQWLSLAIPEAPTRFYLALTGNVHSRLVAPEGRVTMGARLHELRPQINVVALQATYAAGTAWVCTRDGCGVIDIAVDVRGPTSQVRGIELFERISKAGFSGTYHVGAIDASPPVRDRD